MTADPLVLDLGRRSYDEGYAIQCEHLDRVLAAREAGEPVIGTILLVEHDPPVVTVSRREGAMRNLIATPEQLARAGVTVAQTDRGGDITYHGPGQLVVYPILDLNHLGLGLHDYMRLLEGAVIDACSDLGVAAERDACATGVWVPREGQNGAAGVCGTAGAAASAKICAMGVRVRRWITMHGLALNVTTNLDHFRLIVPCGLAGRPVTSLQNELGTSTPGMDRVKAVLTGRLIARLVESSDGARRRRHGAAGADPTAATPA